MQNLNYKKGISICITAYKMGKFIKETLSSVAEQTWFVEHNNYEILVGIDNCQETLDVVKEIMGNYKNIRVFMMDSNKGTYVTSNTIMSLAQYDCLLRFDADDIMHKDMVEKMMAVESKYDLVTCFYKLFSDEGNKVFPKPTGLAWGQLFLHHEIFDKFGGYKPWICNADYELMTRLKKVTSKKDLGVPLFDKRVHETNLTVAKETNQQSALRKKLNLEVRKLNIVKPEDAIIKKETNTYTEIKPLSFT